MKKILKTIGIILGTLLLLLSVYLLTTHDPLPEGIQGKEADMLANRMMKAMNKRAFDNTEILEWSFRGKHHYKWKKQEGIVEVLWDDNKVILDLNENSKSKGQSPALIKIAHDFFNNDSFWLVAPYKVFDNGTERSIVKYNDKNALMVKYTSGGSTPGDSYLWILDSTYTPIAFKMWTQIIPIGGVSASWNNLTTAASGIKLPTKHKLSLFGFEINMGEVKAYNPNADYLAHKILKAVKHDAYINTRFIDWSFRGKRFYSWDKEQHIVTVQWNDAKVILHPNDLKQSSVFLNGKEIKNSQNLIKRALRLFNNDSFWLVAPHKLFDRGSFRALEMVDGKEALYITYSKGGSTPGDSYRWILGPNFIPLSYQMYVPSMKMDGVSASWEDWIVTESGTLLPKNHIYTSGRILNMGNVKGYN